jgi:hypothetical protein
MIRRARLDALVETSIDDRSRHMEVPIAKEDLSVSLL